MKYPPTYETATITFPYDQNAAGVNQEYIAASEKCPPIYTPTNYVAYFAMHKNHPDKFVFFKIGQVPLPPAAPTGKKTLDETIQFFP
jgi:hypothetical protein